MDLYFPGRAWLNKGVSYDTLMCARGYFERAATLDPDNLAAVHGTAVVDTLAVTTYAVDEPTARVNSAQTTLTQLLLREPNNARFRFTMGLLLVWTNRAAQGLAELERTLALDPNLATAHAQIGSAKLLLGRPEETEAHVLEAIRLSPRDTAAFGWTAVAGSAKMCLGAEEEAVAWYRRSIEINGGYHFVHFSLGAVLAVVGKLEEARSEIQAGLALNPKFTIRRYRAAAPSDNPGYIRLRERMIEGMRKAGVPEG